MRVSCAFPTTESSPDDIALAEEIGYERAWLYDTPQQSPDVWMSLALAAERTSRIGLGPGVLVPHLRHPMTNAAATATLVGLAPGRVAVSFGTGFTGRRAMGYRAIPWSFMSAYIDAYCGLLRGDVVEWEGARMQMLHPDGSAPARPIDVPVLIGALGPKGRAVAAKYDGVFATTTLEGLEPGAFDVGGLPLLGHGARPRARTCRRSACSPPPGRAAPSPTTPPTSCTGATPCPTSPAARSGSRSSTSGLRPSATSTSTSATASTSTTPTAAAWDATGGALLPATTITGTADEIKAKIDELGAKGVTEVVFQPCGPDIRRELEAMYAAVGG